MLVSDQNAHSAPLNLPGVLRAVVQIEGRRSTLVPKPFALTKFVMLNRLREQFDATPRHRR